MGNSREGGRLCGVVLSGLLLRHALRLLRLEPFAGRVARGGLRRLRRLRRLATRVLGFGPLFLRARRRRPVLVRRRRQPLLPRLPPHHPHFHFENIIIIVFVERSARGCAGGRTAGRGGVQAGGGAGGARGEGQRM